MNGLERQIMMADERHAARLELPNAGAFPEMIRALSDRWAPFVSHRSDEWLTGAQTCAARWGFHRCDHLMSRVEYPDASAVMVAHWTAIGMTLIRMAADHEDGWIRGPLLGIPWWSAIDRAERPHNDSGGVWMRWCDRVTKGDMPPIPRVTSPIGWGEQMADWYWSQRHSYRWSCPHGQPHGLVEGTCWHRRDGECDGCCGR